MADAVQCIACPTLVPRTRGNRLYCSRTCYEANRPRSAFSHTERNTHRTRWIGRVWYGPNVDMVAWMDGKQQGRSCERYAQSLVLPKLGFTDCIDLSSICYASPADLTAKLAGRRTLIDMTRKWQKRVHGKAAFAAALDMDFYVLAISPRDCRFHSLIRVGKAARTVRVQIAFLRHMALEIGEVGDGRPD